MATSLPGPNFSPVFLNLYILSVSLYVPGGGLSRLLDEVKSDFFPKPKLVDLLLLESGIMYIASCELRLLELTLTGPKETYRLSEMKRGTLPLSCW